MGGILQGKPRPVSGCMAGRFAPLFTLANCFPALPAFSQEDVSTTDCSTSGGRKAVTQTSVWPFPGEKDVFQPANETKANVWVCFYAGEDQV